MKKTTRILALLFSVLMVLSLFACSDAPSEKPEDSSEAVVSTAGDTEPGETQLKANLPDTKYGKDFMIASGYVGDTKYTTDLIVSSETNGEIINDAIYARTVLMEETFDIKMVVEDVTPAKLKTAHGAGEHVYDIGTATLSEITTVLNAGLAADLNTIGTVDLEKPWWDQNANAKFRIKDKLFYTFSDFFITGIDNCRACYFCKDYAKDLGIDTLYKLAADGTWTFDKFREMCVLALNDSDGNGVIDPTDKVGIGMATTQFYEAVMSGCDMEPVKQGDDGIAYYAANRDPEKYIEVYTQVLDWFTKDNAYISTFTNTNGLDALRNGSELFLLYSFGACQELRATAVAEFGILPIPKYNEDQKNYQHTSPNGDALFICPGSAEEMEFAGVMCEAASYFSSKYYSDKAVMPSYFDLALSYKNVSDVESSGNVQIIHDTISYTIKLYGTDYMGAIYNALAAKNYNIASVIKTQDRAQVKKIPDILAGLGITVD